MISLRAVHSIKTRASSLQCNGIRLIMNQRRTGNALQYIKQTTLTSNGLHLPRILNNNFSSFSLSTSQKLVPKSLIYQQRPFHATQPTSATSFITFKTVNAVLVIRKLSNLLFSFFPFALRKNPKTGRRRRLLIFITTVMPLTGFCILILAGIDPAPNTGRLRFKFMSEKEERELCDSLFSRETEKYQNKFLSLDRLENKFVCHVMNNLVKGLNDDLMTLKSFKNLSDNESSEKAAIIIGENVDNMSDKNTTIRQGETNPKPFEIYVIEDDEVLNAISFGASKKIIIFTGNVITREFVIFFFFLLIFNLLI
jgi:hypothetical protein